MSRGRNISLSIKLMMLLTLLLGFTIAPAFGQDFQEQAGEGAAAVESGVIETVKAIEGIVGEAEEAAEEAPELTFNSGYSVDGDGAISWNPKFITDTLWIMIAGMLVFIMHLGFATLETGLTRAKNTVNI